MKWKIVTAIITVLVGKKNRRLFRDSLPMSKREEYYEWMIKKRMKDIRNYCSLYKLHIP